MKCIKEKCRYFIKHDSTCKLKEDEYYIYLYTNKNYNCVAESNVNLKLNEDD